MSTTRLALRALTAIAACAVALAGVVAWVDFSQDGRHGLGADHAACFEFGLIERRISQSVTRKAQRELELPPIPQVRELLQQEVVALNKLTADHTSASYRLIEAFAAVGDASVGALRKPRPAGPSDFFVDGLVARFDAVRDARTLCAEFGFDTERLEPR